MSSPKRTVWFHIFDVLLNIVIIVAIVGFIRTFLVSPFQVEGSSMVDTLENNQYIIINKLAYHIGEPVRGEVVVFRPPTDHKKHYVKRLVGIPGDSISIRDGNVFITPASQTKEVALDEEYLNDRSAGHTYKHPPSTGNTEEVHFEVPEGHYFLLGDNRQGSLDSRSFDPPYVPKKDITGKVWFVALPVKKIHSLESPDYQL
ncbi:signal peptidase I [Patescibacteria group bacterium]|nr:signal peptidase I [Patescibacteria group bacterium]MBU1124149.1 signal peptidase I [Patescibacteria group bacterium]